ncbi:MAG: GNAT family N-acetyltransferase [Flavobacteriaceae bacterium]
MYTNFKIQLIAEEQMETIIPLVFELNGGKIPMVILKERLQAMLNTGGYQCIGAYDANDLVGICGLWILNKLYVGKHVEPDNVFVKKEYRSRGVGQLMMDWLFAYAKEIGCIGSEVNCYKANDRANAFCERLGYESKGFRLIKKF